MIDRNIRLLTCFFVLILFDRLLFSNTITIIPVVLQGHSAPGTGGGSFSRFGQVSVNNAGTVVFNAGVNGGTTGGGVFLASRGTIQPIALSGQTPPGIANGVFTGFRSPLINDRGEVTFIGVINEGSQSGVFVFSGGKLSKAASSFEVAKNAGIGVISVTGHSTNDSDPATVAFSATTFTPQAGNTEAIFLFSSGAQLAAAAVPDGQSAAAFGAPSINDSGAMLVSLTRDATAQDPGSVRDLPVLFASLSTANFSEARWNEDVARTLQDYSGNYAQPKKRTTLVLKLVGAGLMGLGTYLMLSPTREKWRPFDTGFGRKWVGYRSDTHRWVGVGIFGAGMVLTWQGFRRD